MALQTQAPLSLVVENSKLRSDLLAEKIINAQLQHLCTGFEKALGDRDVSVKIFQAQLEEAAKEGQKAAAANAASIEALNEQTAAITARFTESQQSVAHSAALAASANQLSSQLSSMAALLADSQRDLGSRDDELRAKAVEIAALQAERADLTQRLHSHNALKVSAPQKSKQRNTVWQNLDLLFWTLQGHHAELSSQLGSITELLATLQHDLAGRDAEIKVKSSEISALQKERAELAQRLYGHDELKV
jgi:hypothetical protein